MIKIGESWGIEMDDTCVTILQRKIVLTGENEGDEVWRPMWYYADLESAFHSLVDRDIQNQITNRFPMLIERIAELKKEIHDALEKHSKEINEYESVMHKPMIPIRKNR
ncbi:hypothetical protein LCGC14_1352050 [marine sediment metagenome]|uniref:Uncharacterized protein n=1 Tax=marine sediment metagenome TaxID=412755 RepID=A0A0F9NCT5_9ZZZZ